MSAGDIYERDPDEYVAAFEDYLGRWEGSDEERDLAEWTTVAEVGTYDDDVSRLVALGYIVATWEQWNPGIADTRLGLFENMRRKSARQFASHGVPEELFDVMYGANVMRAQIAEQGQPGDASLSDRLTLLWERVVLRNTQFETAPSAETIRDMRTIYDLGIGLNLFVRWHHGMDERGVPEDERWDDIGLAPLYDDRLADLQLPATIRGCTLDEADTLGYEIRSEGKLGGYHLTSFLAEGDVAKILQFVTSGRLGTRAMKMPEPSHVDVLRDLGFQQAIFPNGERYQLSSWGGLSGIRKIKSREG